MRVDQQVISGNQDFPEGGFDGFLQSIVCKKVQINVPLSNYCIMINAFSIHFAAVFVFTIAVAEPAIKINTSFSIFLTDGWMEGCFQKAPVVPE